jgi:hypothetical protein
MEWNVARMGERMGACMILVWRHDGKRLLSRHACRRDDNIKMILEEVRWGMDWIDLAQGRDRWRVRVMW